MKQVLSRLSARQIEQPRASFDRRGAALHISVSEPTPVMFCTESKCGVAADAADIESNVGCCWSQHGRVVMNERSDENRGDIVTAPRLLLVSMCIILLQ